MSSPAVRIRGDPTDTSRASTVVSPRFRASIPAATNTAPADRPGCSRADLVRRSKRPVAGTGRFEGRIADQRRLDGVEVFEESRCPDETAPSHRSDIGRVLRVTPVDLGERRAVVIVVVVIHASVPVDERAASMPSRQFRDEIIGGGQLDVDVQGLLGSGDRLEDSCRLRVESWVNGHRGLSPAQEYGEAAADEADPSVAPNHAPRKAHQFTHLIGSVRRAYGIVISHVIYVTLKKWSHTRRWASRRVRPRQTRQLRSTAEWLLPR